MLDRMDDHVFSTDLIENQVRIRNGHKTSYVGIIRLFARMWMMPQTVGNVPDPRDYLFRPLRRSRIEVTGNISDIGERRFRVTKPHKPWLTQTA